MDKVNTVIVQIREFVKLHKIFFSYVGFGLIIVAGNMVIDLIFEGKIGPDQVTMYGIGMSIFIMFGLGLEKRNKKLQAQKEAEAQKAKGGKAKKKAK